jgi:hydrogenase expression/formation protein HypC
MCLAVPAEIVEIRENDLALIDVGGVRREISLMLVEGVEVGDFVLVHAGFAIEKIDQSEALKTLDILEEMAKLDEAL